MKKKRWVLLISLLLCTLFITSCQQETSVEMPETPVEETAGNPGGLYLTDYMDMTVGEIMEFWGEDVVYLDGWKGGAMKGFEYEDGRIPLMFGFLDPELTGYATGQEELYELRYDTEECGDIPWVAPGLASDSSYPELIDQGLSGSLLKEIVEGDEIHWGAEGYFHCTYSDTVHLCFIWWEGRDPYTEPADYITLERPEEDFEPEVDTGTDGSLETMPQEVSRETYYGQYGTSFIVPDGFVQEEAIGPLGPYFLFVHPGYDMTISIVDEMWQNIPGWDGKYPDYEATLANYGNSCTYSFEKDGQMVFSGYEGDQIYYRSTFYSTDCVTWVDIYYPEANATMCNPIVSTFMSGFSGYR